MEFSNKFLYLSMSNNELKHIGYGNHVQYTISSMVELTQTLTVVDGTKTIQLGVKISSDFNTVPEKYREVFLNMVTSRYYGTVSFGDNPFSKCQPPPQKRWWQFWK